MLRDKVRDRIDAVVGDVGEQKVLEENRAKLRQCMDEKRIAAATSMSRAEYDEETKNITVTKFAGKLIRNMGRIVGRKRLLYPEETLFLMEAAALELSHNGLPLSLAQVYSLFLSNDDLSCDQFVVYAHLTRAGYIAVRHRGRSRKETLGSATSDIQDISADEGQTRKLSIVYDVHLPDSGYILSKRQVPDHHLLIMRPEESITVDELRRVQLELNDGVPLHAAVVDHAEVTCFCLDWVITPDIRHD